MTQIKIKDLISINDNSFIKKEISLDLYFDKEINRNLCRTYKFFPVNKYNGNKFSSTELLKIFKDNIVNNSKIKKFLVISGYGTGKSHFALACANYFSKSYDSVEFNDIYNSLSSICSEEILKDFIEFKKNTKPQLVIPLSGNNLINLKSGFLKSLKDIIAQNPLLENYQIPPVYSGAFAWIKENLDKKHRKKADKFLLAKYNINVDDLEKRLEAFEIDSELIIIELCKHLFHVTPDFGSEINLEKLITQIFEDLCGKEDSPYDKIMIFFDDLGGYLDNYRINELKYGGSSLREIINACDNLRGKISFIGFIQTDQINYLKKDEKISKIFNFIKKENRYLLAPNLEFVINSIISVSSSFKERALDIVHFDSVSKLSYSSLPSYKKEGWNEKLFFENITLPFYPFHPITISLLCRLNFPAGRAILSFIIDKLNNKLFEPYLISLECKIYGGSIPDYPNWIYPYEIMDYFEENFNRVKDVKHEQLLYSLEQVGNNASEECYIILKSLFIYYNAGLDKTSEHSKIISCLSGIEQSSVKYFLEELKNKYKVIYFNEIRKEYDFYAPGQGILEVYKKLEESISSHVYSSKKLMEYFNKFENEIFEVFAKHHGLDGSEFIFKRNISRNEYYLKPVFICSAEITGDLKLRYEELNKNNTRGIIFYCITDEEKELQEGRKKAQELLSFFRASYGAFPIPVLFAFSDKPVKDFFDILLRIYVIKSWSSSKSKEYGEGYEKAKIELEQKLIEKLQFYFDHLNFITHNDVLKDIPLTRQANQNVIINKLFENSFPFRPSLNYSILKVNSSNNKRYVGILCKLLCMYGGFDIKNIEQFDKTTRNCIINIFEKIIHTGNSKWNILDDDSRIIVPKEPVIYKGWNLLDKKSENGKFVNLLEIYKIFHEPPFGYDDLTFSLLLSCWMGYNRYYVEIFSGSNKIEVSSFYSNFDGLSIISKINEEKFSIRRLEATSFLCEINKLKENLKSNNKEYEEVKNLVIQAGNILNNKRCPDDEVKKIKVLIAPKEEIVTKVEKFFEAIDLLKKQLDLSLNVVKSCKIRKKIKDIILPENINYSMENYNSLINQCELKIKEQLKAELVDLEKIEDYTHLKKDFEEIKIYLNKIDLPELENITEEKILKLEKQYKEIQIYEEEKRIFETIKNLPPPNHLPFIEILNNLDIITSFFKKVEIEFFRAEIQKKLKVYLGQIEFLKKDIQLLPEKIASVSCVSECDLLADKLKEKLLTYISSEYEGKFHEFFKCLEEKKRVLENKEKIIEEKKLLLQEFSNIKNLSRNKDIMVIYKLYSQMVNKKIPEKFLEKDEYEQIEKQKKIVFDKFSLLLSKDLSDIRVIKKFDYITRKKRFKIFEKKFKPVGKINKNFLEPIFAAKRNLESEFSKWKELQKKEKRKKEIRKLISFIEGLPADRISLCNNVVERLDNLERELVLDSELSILFRDDISLLRNKILNYKNSFMVRLQTYKSLIKDITDYVELRNLKEELLKISYIFNDSYSEKEFTELLGNVNNKISQLSFKGDIKQILNMFYNIEKSQTRIDCAVKLFNVLGADEQKRAFDLIKNKFL